LSWCLCCRNKRDGAKGAEEADELHFERVFLLNDQLKNEIKDEEKRMNEVELLLGSDDGDEAESVSTGCPVVGAQASGIWN
jgi:hypothetical protein